MVVSEREDLVALIADPVSFLGHSDAVLRRMATTALSAERCDAVFDTVVGLLNDESASVRAAAAEKLGACGRRALPSLDRVADDPEAKVREAVTTAYGDIGASEPIEWLADIATNDPDRTVREAAVAALGAIGDDHAIDPLLEFIASGPPQVRRRAIAAITVFDDPRIEPALQRAALDRNPGVREAAEMVVGKQMDR